MAKKKIFFGAVIIVGLAGLACVSVDVYNGMKDSNVNVSEIITVPDSVEKPLKVISENIGKVETPTNETSNGSKTDYSKLQDVSDIGTVVRVVDGDTYVLNISNEEKKVRLIGVDTPESVAPADYRKDNTDEGKEVSDIVKEKIKEGDTLFVEYDVSETDRYGRTLAYLYFTDGTMVQEWLLNEGYANVATYAPNVKYSVHFAELAHTAMENKVGLWNGFFEENVQ